MTNESTESSARLVRVRLPDIGLKEVMVSWYVLTEERCLTTTCYCITLVAEYVFALAGMYV